MKTAVFADLHDNNAGLNAVLGDGAEPIGDTPHGHPGGEPQHRIRPPCEGDPQDDSADDLRRQDAGGSASGGPGRVARDLKAYGPSSASAAVRRTRSLMASKACAFTAASPRAARTRAPTRSTAYWCCR